MAQWHKTGCVLCAQNCGLEALVEDGRMVKIRPDKDNPRSRGYVCRKGLNVLYHQYPADRLTEPLKRVGDRFQPLSWDRALDEIADRLKSIVAEHSPRSVAYMGGAAQGGQTEAAFGLGLIRGLGSQYYYSSAGQEFSGQWWVSGRILGRQYNLTVPDEAETDMLVAWGWNGMMSHQMPRARTVLKEFSAHPDKLLVAVDPRLSETAEAADIHLTVRPGSDALLMKAMIALILDRGWQNQAYLDCLVKGWDQVRPWFEGFDIQAALTVCRVDYGQVEELCRLMATRRWSVHLDLGLYMGRHSTLNSYLLMLLGAVCGTYCVRGGNVIPGYLVPIGFHADERHPKTWRTAATDMPPVAGGSFPPAVLPEEALSDRPDRLRALLVSASNPLRAYPDTTAYERAFRALDLVVVNDIVMTETARLADYVLPCRTFYEAWDGSFFPLTYPDIFFQLRRPVVEPPPLAKEAAQIHTELADRLGLIPDIPDHLIEAASGHRLAFGAQLMAWAKENPAVKARLPFVLAKTLGRVWDSAAKAALWGILVTTPPVFSQRAARAGFEPGPDQGDRIFQALLDRPEGVWIGRVDVDNPAEDLKTESGRLEVFIPELAETAQAIQPPIEAAALEPDPELPLILSAGRHMDRNINTMLRNPDWNRGRRACTVALSPADADRLGLTDGQAVRVTTAAGSETGELEVSGRVGPGQVLIPHGFGLIYDGQVYGLNVNRLTSAANRDPLGTPLHRYVPCRVEAV